jgi:hypothetical protein
MIIGEPLGLLALAGLPALVALHLWRARHAPRPTTALFLWPADRRVLSAGRRRAPLVLRGSFWCEVLAILAAAWWLADVHWSPRAPARHLLVVLDDRWRLQAVVEGASVESRLREALDARLAALDPADRVTLIASGEPPRLLVGPAAAVAQARNALAAWRPAGAWHGPEAALALAAGLGGKGSEIVLASDRRPARLPEGCGLLALGRRAGSSGIADVRWWRDGRGERLVVSVYGDQPRVPRLRVAGIELAPEPGAAGVHVFTGLPPMAEAVEAELVLSGDDPLPLDDRVTLIRPPLRQVRALVGGDALSSAAARLALVASGAVVAAGGEAELAVGVPPPPGAWELRLSPGSGAATRGPYTARRDHPLLADVDLGGLVWTGGSPGAGGAPLLAAGDQVLIALAVGDGTCQVTLHIDAARSSLFKHEAWPSLVANLVAWRAAALPGVADPNPRCGQPVQAMLPGGNATAELVDPGGAVRTLRAGSDGAVLVPGLGQPGRWLLRWTGGAQPLNALPLDPRQGDLADAATAEVAAVVAGRAELERRRGPLAALLPLVLAAAAAFAAWILFRREERP